MAGLHLFVIIISIKYCFSADKSRIGESRGLGCVDQPVGVFPLPLVCKTEYADK